MVAALSPQYDSAIHVVNTTFHSHSDYEKKAFVDSILDSKFVLCPRGWFPVTYRLFEVMELGRCPVIISDQWVPIQGIPWDECTIQVPEVDVGNIPEIASSAKSVGNFHREMIASN